MGTVIRIGSPYRTALAPWPPWGW